MFAYPIFPYALQWRHINVMPSQITSNAVVPGNNKENIKTLHYLQSAINAENIPMEFMFMDETEFVHTLRQKTGNVHYILSTQNEFMNTSLSKNLIKTINDKTTTLHIKRTELWIYRFMVDKIEGKRCTLWNTFKAIAAGVVTIWYVFRYWFWQLVNINSCCVWFA